MKQIFASGATVLAVVVLAACASQENKTQVKNPTRYTGVEETPSPAPAATPAAPESTPAPTSLKPPGDTHVQQGDVPSGIPVPGKPGYVLSPYAKTQGYVDVRGFPPGTEVKCPYTGKVFLVP